MLALEMQEGGEWPRGQAETGQREDAKCLCTNQRATPAESHHPVYLGLLRLQCSPTPASPEAAAYSTSSNSCPQSWEGKGRSKTLNSHFADNSGHWADSCKYILLFQTTRSLSLHRNIHTHFAHQNFLKEINYIINPITQ